MRTPPFKTLADVKLLQWHHHSKYGVKSSKKHACYWRWKTWLGIISYEITPQNLPAHDVHVRMKNNEDLCGFVEQCGLSHWRLKRCQILEPSTERNTSNPQCKYKLWQELTQIPKQSRSLSSCSKSNQCTASCHQVVTSFCRVCPDESVTSSTSGSNDGTSGSSRSSGNSKTELIILQYCWSSCTYMNIHNIFVGDHAWRKTDDTNYFRFLEAVTTLLSS